MKRVSSQWMREAVQAAYRQLGLPTGWTSEQTETFGMSQQSWMTLGKIALGAAAVTSAAVFACFSESLPSVAETSVRSICSIARVVSRK